MQFPQNYRTPELAIKPKGLKQILKERGLWDREYYTSYLTGNGRPGYGPKRRCYARKILVTE